MGYFQVKVRDYPTEYGFMSSLQLYLVEKSGNPGPIVIIAPGGGYIKLNQCRMFVKVGNTHAKLGL